MQLTEPVNFETPSYFSKPLGKPIKDEMRSILLSTPTQRPGMGTTGDTAGPGDRGAVSSLQWKLGGEIVGIVCVRYGLSSVGERG